MRNGISLLITVALAAPAMAPAEEHVLPAFAMRLAGKGANVWSSELLVTNPGGEPRLVSVAGFLPGRLGAQTPCLPPVGPRIVPAHSTVVWTAAAIGRDLGCPTFALGGLVLAADGQLSITSRMVNERGPGRGELAPLSGLGQEVAAVAAGDLVPPGALTMLPGVAWHANACGRRLFETYLHLANPGEDEVVVTLMANAAGDASALLVDGREVAVPRDFTVAPRTWLQLKVDPVDSPLAVCLPPVAADLFFTASGRLAAVASVVDRTTQDPRTVAPIAVLR